MIHPWNEPVWASLPALERLPRVLLLTGPRGVGKSRFALELAGALLCRELAPLQRPCGQCVGCRLLGSANHPDLRILEPAAAGDDDGPGDDASKGKPAAASRWIKVDAVRGLADFLSLTSHLGGTKVVLIDPADRLHASAANALLKTLEEPVNTVFFLVTSQPARLPATVRSRCVRIGFHLPAARDAMQWLRGQGVAEPELALAAAGGAPLRALDLGAEPHWSVRRDLIRLIFSNPGFDPVAAVDALGPEQVGLLVPALQRWCFDLTLSAACGRLRYHPDCAQILHPIARRTDRNALLGFLAALGEVAGHLEHPLNPRLLAERCLIGYRNAIAGTET